MGKTLEYFRLSYLYEKNENKKNKINGDIHTPASSKFVFYLVIPWKENNAKDGRYYERWEAMYAGNDIN